MKTHLLFPVDRPWVDVKVKSRTEKSQLWRRSNRRNKKAEAKSFLTASAIRFSIQLFQYKLYQIEGVP
jgi:hypothetical protein